VEWLLNQPGGHFLNQASLDNSIRNRHVPLVRFHLRYLSSDLLWNSILEKWQNTAPVLWQQHENTKAAAAAATVTGAAAATAAGGSGNVDQCLDWDNFINDCFQPHRLVLLMPLHGLVHQSIRITIDTRKSTGMKSSGRNGDDAATVQPLSSYRASRTLVPYATTRPATSPWEAFLRSDLIDTRPMLRLLYEFAGFSVEPHFTETRIKTIVDITSIVEA
jgi:hypothetical protein